VGQPGQRFPVKTEYFIPHGNDAAVRKFVEKYGDKPRAIDIRLPSSLGTFLEIKHVAFAGGNKDKGGVLKAIGRTNFALEGTLGGPDVLTVFNVGKDADGKPELQPVDIEISGVDDPQAQALGVYLQMTATFGIPDVLGFGGVAETHSKGQGVDRHSLARRRRHLRAARRARVDGAAPEAAAEAVEDADARRDLRAGLRPRPVRAGVARRGVRPDARVPRADRPRDAGAVRACGAGGGAHRGFAGGASAGGRAAPGSPPALADGNGDGVAAAGAPSPTVAATPEPEPEPEPSRRRRRSRTPRSSTTSRSRARRGVRRAGRPVRQGRHEGEGARPPRRDDARAGVRARRRRPQLAPVGAPQRERDHAGGQEYVDAVWTFAHFNAPTSTPRSARRRSHREHPGAGAAGGEPLDARSSIKLSATRRARRRSRSRCTSATTEQAVDQARDLAVRTYRELSHNFGSRAA
jgi:hypothetical protein